MANINQVFYRGDLTSSLVILINRVEQEQDGELKEGKLDLLSTLALCFSEENHDVCAIITRNFHPSDIAGIIKGVMAIILTKDGCTQSYCKGVKTAVAAFCEMFHVNPQKLFTEFCKMAIELNLGHETITAIKPLSH